jgi:hypothetical protein
MTRAQARPWLQASGLFGSGFFVGFYIAVDQGRDVVIIFFLFFEECIVGGVVAKIDIVIHHGCNLFIGGVRILKRYDFRAGFRQFGLFILGGGGARGGPGQGGRLEGRSAFGTKNGVFIQIEKFRAAILALALAAELRFGHF